MILINRVNAINQIERTAQMNPTVVIFFVVPERNVLNRQYDLTFAHLTDRKISSDGDGDASRRRGVRGIHTGTVEDGWGKRATPIRANERMER